MKLVKICICLLLVGISCKTTTKTSDDESVIQTPKLKFEEVTDVQLASGKLFRINQYPSNYVKPRTVDVWLPDGYSNTKKYNVLYMHDGQMLFDATNTWNNQEWKVDEWISTLTKENKIQDCIVVAVHSLTQYRWMDLFPERAFDYVDSHQQEYLKSLHSNVAFNLTGDEYLKFIVNEIKPLIDSNYSVFTDKEHTFMMGSSMGGLMSMYAISEYPDVFGGVACISTHWIGSLPLPNNPYPDAIFDYMEANLADSKGHKIYFDYGNKTLDANYPVYASKVDETLVLKGYNETNSKNILFDGADHSENSWNQRLDHPLLFLLEK